MKPTNRDDLESKISRATGVGANLRSAEQISIDIELKIKNNFCLQRLVKKWTRRIPEKLG
jgi:hypothetical protein